MARCPRLRTTKQRAGNGDVRVSEIVHCLVIGDEQILMEPSIFSLRRCIAVQGGVTGARRTVKVFSPGITLMSGRLLKFCVAVESQASSLSNLVESSRIFGI